MGWGWPQGSVPQRSILSSNGVVIIKHLPAALYKPTVHCLVGVFIFFHRAHSHPLHFVLYRSPLQAVSPSLSLSTVPGLPVLGFQVMDPTRSSPDDGGSRLRFGVLSRSVPFTL